MSHYLVATVKPWNIRAFHRHTPGMSGDWAIVGSPDELSSATGDRTPRYIFFPHWSWRVPDALLEQTECVCFHMTDLPYGRGGSPLQNLILRGHRHTQLSALRMVRELDAGPVYGKRPLSLEGRAEDIYERAADLTYDLVRWIVSNNPRPVPQEGEPVVFRRRRPEESELPDGTTEELFDHIRMLDAETYPRAYVAHGRWHIQLSEPEMDGDGLSGRFRIRPPEEET